MNVVCFNILLFLFLIIIYNYKWKENKVALFVLIEYLISSFTGIFLVSWTSERTYSNLSYDGSIIFLFIFIISFWPLIVVKIDKNFNVISNQNMLDKLGILFYYGSIIAFVFSIGMVMDFFSTSNIAEYMIETHDARFQTTEKDASNIIVDLAVKPAYYCKAFLPLFMVYYLNRYNKITKAVWGVILMQLYLIIMSMLNSSRFMIADFTLTNLFVYFLTYNQMTQFTKKVFNITFKYGGLLILGVLSIITIGRAISMGYIDYLSVLSWISVYTGEGMLNFNEFTISDTSRTGIGELIIFFRDSNSIFNDMTSSEYTEYWAAILGHEANTFKSAYGDFVASIGLYESFLSLFCLSSAIIFFLKKRINTFSNIALFIVLMKYVYFGFMYFPYGGVSGNNYFYQALIAILILKIFEKNVTGKSL